MPNVPGLRSPYVKLGRIVYLGRMLDKIRLHAAGKLPADYVANLGDDRPGIFDARCCLFLGVRYADLKTHVLKGGTDDDIVAWLDQNGAKNSDGQCFIWNAFMMKRGWRDDGAAILAQRIADNQLGDKPVMTMFDFLDFDEGRDPVATRAWEQS